ncbi:hypothetical protein R1flu_022671 [Riccia fluitans]|uniref:Uncharacterized protein n=1 Tax=Riccia fluitans TaxID=41844 RepID=A0ABD1XQC0_9MARC
MSQEEIKRGRLPRRGDVKAQIATNIVNSIAGILKVHRSRSSSPAMTPLEMEPDSVGNWPADPESGSLLDPLLEKNQ